MTVAFSLSQFAKQHHKVVPFDASHNTSNLISDV